MHGRKKTSEPVSEEARATLSRKASTYTQLVELIVSRRKEGSTSSETLELTAKLLRNNPDYYSLWNYRREILLTQHAALGLGLAAEAQQQTALSDEVGGDIRDQELALSADGIRRNPKSYGAWHHRQWVIERFAFCKASELALCEELLATDQRNFHCWNYRRHMVAVRETKSVEAEHAEQEFAFSTLKIEENFSNYSAFHHRSVYLKKLLLLLKTPIENDDDADDAGAAIEEERRTRGLLDKQDYSERFKSLVEADFGIIQNAIYTEPDDQSAWWYHQFLLSWADEQITVGEDEKLAQWLLQLMLAQIEVVKELLEVEGGESKMAMTCCASTMHKAVSFAKRHSLSSEEALNALCDERTSILQRLIVSDPMHAKRYQYLLLSSSSA